MSTPQNPKVTISAPDQTTEGATIKSLYVERKVKVYAIHEPELDNISSLNSLSLIAFSIASFFLAVACRDGFSKEVSSKK